MNLDAYPALASGYESHRIGGEEVQHSLLSTMFAAQGYEVQLVTADFGQGLSTHIDGVRVLSSFRPDAGLPGLRFIHPRWTRLNAALKRADADIYYVSCAGALVGWVAQFAKRHGRRMVFRVASDTDCDPNRLLISLARDRWLYRYGLRRAHAVLAQTDHQAELLKKHYGLNSTVAPMALHVPSAAQVSGEKDIDVLWVANMRALKRPELFVQAAQRLPQWRFHLVGGSMQGEPEVFSRICNQSATVSNLTLHGRVGFQATLALMKRARLFASTSVIEGFPNTFLQAWAREVPTVSFFDPDGLVERHGLGACVDSLDALVLQIDTLLRDRARLCCLSQTCGEFIRQRYTHESILRPYADVFSSVMAKAP